MSAFFIINQADPSRQELLAAALEASFSRQGFERPHTHTWQQGRVTWYETPANPGSIEQRCTFDNGFIACVGTLFFRGQSGLAALQAFWLAFEGSSSARTSELGGEYQVVLCKNNTTWAFGDALGMIKLYETPQTGVLSTSWLACLSVAQQRVLDSVGALDYVFSGANHGCRTPCEQVRIVDPAVVLNLADGSRTAVFNAAFWQPELLFSNEDQALDMIAERLRQLARAYAAHYQGRIKCALSGGYDSRLILAALMSAGVTPKLHVYGAPDNEDVIVAKAIDAAMHLGLQAIDKRQLDTELASRGKPDLLSNLNFFDGIPIDGILDDGADRATRLNQSRDGALALNGGGGEVLRNFFYLADRRFSAADIVKVFYSGFDPAAVRSATVLQTFRDYLTHTIESEVGATGLFTRQQVEMIYPLIRGRYWTSRNNSMAARSGHFLTPLLDPLVVKASARLPMTWKDYGKFEAKLITRVSPELGRFPMAYGFSPEQGPPVAYRFKMWLQHQRPPWVRAATAGVKRRVKALRLGLPASQPSICVANYSDLHNLIDPALLTAADQRARFATLQGAFNLVT